MGRGSGDDQREELAARLRGSAPFAGIDAAEARAMLGCLRVRTRAYSAGEAILHMGDTVRELGIVLSGGVRIERCDPWGDVTVLGYARELDAFAESYACAPGTPLLVDAVAAKPSEVAFLDMRCVLAPCGRGCAHHAKLVANLLAIAARKNIELSRRAFHTAPKSLRGKLLAYLGSEADAAGSPSFTIPYNRQQLADYLGVDRSALSAELSRMQREGILATKRSRFELLGPTVRSAR